MRERERQRERKREKETEAIVFYNLISEVAYHQLYSIGHTDQTLMQSGKEPCKGLKTSV